MSARPAARTLVLAVLVAAGAAPASACLTVVAPHRTSLWQRLTDWTPPAPAAAPSLRVRRGIGPRPADRTGAVYMSSCDDIGFVELTFPTPADSAEVVGYVFEVLAGHAPEGLVPERALRIVPSPRPGDDARRIRLGWIDGATDRQEPLSFVLGIWTVDRAGNRSHTATTVLVRDPGR